MNSRTWLLLFAFAGLPVVEVFGEELEQTRVTVDTTAAPVGPAKPNFDLSDAEMKRLLRRATTAPQADPRVVEFWLAAWRAPASETRRKIEVPTNPQRLRPAVVECGAINENCAAYDADGKYLRAVPRPPGPPTFAESNYGADSAGCLGSNDMMSIFEREQRCRGIGRVIPSFWEPSSLRFAPPLRVRAD
jgi:hypothetical protein